MAKTKVIPTQSRLHDVLDYDPKTGVFHWKKLTGRRAKIGDVAGFVMPIGHLIIGIDGARHLAHRLAWLYMTGEWPSQEVDHKDRNPLNNRFDNLRLATHKENMRNRKLAGNNTSGYTGVRRLRNTDRWIARIKCDKEEIHLGVYSSAAEAAEVYDRKAKELFGEFARLNFEVPDGDDS